MSDGNSTPLRLLGYGRCSDPTQEESVPDQLAWMLPHVEKEGHTLLAEPFTDEGVPGRRIKTRDGLQALLAKAKQLHKRGESADGIIVWHLNRFSRAKPWDTIEVYQELRRAGIRLLLTQSQTYNMEDAMHQVVLSLQQMTASQFSPEMARAVTRAKVRKAREKGSVAPPPLGYRTVYREGRKAGQLVPDGWEIVPDEAAIVRRIWRAYLSGKHSLRSIALELNRDGVPTATRIRGRKPRKGTREGWRYNSVQKVLTNDAYLGIHTWGRRRNGAFLCVVDGEPVERPKEEARGADEPRKAVMNDPSQWIRRAKHHDALVEPEDWDKVQALLALNEKSPAASQGRRIYLFAGLLKCGRCGAGMAGFQRRSGGPGYRCLNVQNKGATFCDGRGARADEAEVIDALVRRLRERFTPEFFAEFTEACRLALQKAKDGPDAAELELARKQLAELSAEAEVRRKNLGRAKEELFATLQDDYLALCQQRDELAARIASAQEPPEVPDVEERIATAREDLETLLATILRADREESRAVLREHFDHADVFLGQTTPGKKTPFERAAFFVREGSPLKAFCEDGPLLSVPHISTLWYCRKSSLLICCNTLVQ